MHADDRILEGNEDAYGHEVWDFFNGLKSFEIVEREDGFFDLSGGPAPYFAEYENWPGIDQEAINLAKGKVLDIGAGAGRVPLYLQKKGLKCVAIDNSKLAIETARKRGIKQAIPMTFGEVGGIGQLFDTIVMFGNNFGLFHDRQNVIRMLGVLYDVTSSDAIILASSLNPYKGDIAEHKQYQEYNLTRGRMAGQIRIRVRYHKYSTPYFDYLFVSPEEMAEILDHTNWRISRLFIDEKPSFIAVLEKK